MAFVVSTLGADVNAQVVVGGKSPEAATLDHLYHAGVQPIGTLLLFAPFGILAWWAERREGCGRKLAARIAFIAVLALFVWHYWSAYQLVPGYEAKRMWTAATLTIGLLPFSAFGLLSMFLVAEWTIGAIGRNLRNRRRNGRSPP